MRRGWPGLSCFVANVTIVGAPFFAHFAKGGHFNCQK